MAPWHHTAAPTCRPNHILTICNYEITGDGCVLTVVNLSICSYLFCIVNIKFMFGPFLCLKSDMFETSAESEGSFFSDEG